MKHLTDIIEAKDGKFYYISTLKLSQNSLLDAMLRAALSRFEPKEDWLMPFETVIMEIVDGEPEPSTVGDDLSDKRVRSINETSAYKAHDAMIERFATKRLTNEEAVQRFPKYRGVLEAKMMPAVEELIKMLRSGGIPKAQG